MEWIVGLIVGILIGGVACWVIQESRSRSRLTKQDADHRETVAGLEGQLAQTYSAHQIVEEAKRQLSDAFQATASRAFETTNQRLLDIADSKLDKTLETAKGEFKQRHEQFQALVRPLSDNYAELNPKIKMLTETANELSAETVKLSGALTNNRQVGAWGEVQLRRVVELAGMIEYCDFVAQHSVEIPGEGRVQPDLIVSLPENRKVVIDAKASTKAYFEASQTEDEDEQAEILKRHARALRSQVDELAGKKYGLLVKGSLDFVVMFVPADQFLAEALRADGKQQNLVEYAIGKRVAIATPSSLMSLLFAVANGWQQQRISESAEEIRKAGEDMHERILTFVRHYSRVGDGLKAAVDAFNRSIGSYDNRLVPQGRRFALLVKGEDESLAKIPASIDEEIRASRYAENSLSRGLGEG